MKIWCYVLKEFQARRLIQVIINPFKILISVDLILFLPMEEITYHLPYMFYVICITLEKNEKVLNMFVIFWYEDWKERVTFV